MIPLVYHRRQLPCHIYQERYPVLRFIHRRYESRHVDQDGTRQFGPGGCQGCAGCAH
jgi:hypothetical protein